MIYTFNEILFGHQKNEILIQAMALDEPWNPYGQWKETEMKGHI